MLGGELVAGRAGRLHHGRVDDERAGGRVQDPLGAPAALALLDELDEAGRLEDPQVVVRLLPGHADDVGDLGRRQRVVQRLQQPPPRR